MKSWVGQALSCRFVLELIDFKLKNDAQESCMRVNFVLFKGFRLIEFEKVATTHVSSIDHSSLDILITTATNADCTMTPTTTTMMPRTMPLTTTPSTIPRNNHSLPTNDDVTVDVPTSDTTTVVSDYNQNTLSCHPIWKLRSPWTQGRSPGQIFSPSQANHSPTKLHPSGNPNFVTASGSPPSNSENYNPPPNTEDTEMSTNNNDNQESGNDGNNDNNHGGISSGNDSGFSNAGGDGDDSGGGDDSGDSDKGGDHNKRKRASFDPGTKGEDSKTYKFFIALDPTSFSENPTTAQNIILNIMKEM